MSVSQDQLLGLWKDDPGFARVFASLSTSLRIRSRAQCVRIP